MTDAQKLKVVAKGCGKSEIEVARLLMKSIKLYPGDPIAQARWFAMRAYEGGDRDDMLRRIREAEERGEL